MSLKKSFLNGTPMRSHTHTHTRSHLYTLTPTSFSQFELALRDLNFFSDGTPPKRRPMNPTYTKTKDIEKKKEKKLKKKTKKQKNREK